jgi:tetratricopeptide (TPR) repeat protein
MTKNHRCISYIAFTVGLVCLLCYLPALKCGFVHIDDPVYVLNNPLIRQLSVDTIVSALTQSHVGWWMPLTWISLALDYHFWGENPYGYHLTNIVLHAVNAGLVVMIADRLLKGQREFNHEKGNSGFLYPALLLIAGLLWGVHPLRVESVAWISERKDVLNGLFSFSSIFFYLVFTATKEDSGKHKSWLFYVLSLLCFILSLMAKSVSVILPLMLLSLDWAPLGRLRRDNVRPIILEKVPFLAASALMAFFTLFFVARSQYLVTYEAFPFMQRLAVSGNAVWEYCRMTLFPVGLSPFYIIPDPIPASYQVKSLLVLVILTGLFCSRIHSVLKSCILCFILPLLPVLAFFQNGDQSYADRFTYLPSLAVVLLIAISLYKFLELSASLSVKRLVFAATAIVVAFFIILTFRQIAVWRTTETYWNRVIEVEPLAISFKERGRYYLLIGRYDAATEDFTSAIGRVTVTLKPYEYNFYAFRAESLRLAGKVADAARDYDTAIGLKPHPAYYYHRGLALRAMGKNSEADEDFRRAGPDPGPINWFD